MEKANPNGGASPSAILSAARLRPLTKAVYEARAHRLGRLRPWSMCCGRAASGTCNPDRAAVAVTGRLLV